MSTTTTRADKAPIQINPDSVADLLFYRKTHASSDDLAVEPYIGPVEISCDAEKVSHGRGLVASRSIAAGELLFATPPTVQASVEEVYQRWLAKQASTLSESQQDRDSYRCLETCAEEVLLDAMQSAYDHQPAMAASFAVLVGSPDDDNHASLTRPPSVSTLLGQDDEAGQTTLPDATIMTRDHFLQIVRANAFGPDGLHSYENVEERWIQAEKNNEKMTAALLQQTTPRLLALYPFADMVNHACLANAVRVYAAGNVMVVHALTDMAAGTEIVYPYVPPTQPLEQRRRALQQQHGFVCACTRCRVEEEQAQETLPFTALLESLQSWNHPRVAPFPTYVQLHKAIRSFEDDFLPLPQFTNEMRRYWRMTYLHVYIHYLNTALHNLQNEADTLVSDILRKDLMLLVTQLHFSFCASHNASTEHLSVLHLCYELVGRQTTSDPAQAQTKLRFWTEQLKKAHMLRYGNLGHDIHNVRRVMQHSRTVLRQANGWQVAECTFL